MANKEKLLTQIRRLHLIKRELECWMQEINAELDEIAFNEATGKREVGKID